MNKKLKSKISIGTAQIIPGYGITNKKKLSISDLKKIIFKARDLEINFIDTAKSYNESEKVLGKIGVKDFNITTKIIIPKLDNMDLSKYINKMITNSLKDLKVKQIYAIYIHNPWQLSKKNEELLNAIFSKAKAKGDVYKTGVSIYSLKDIKKRKTNIEPDIIQAPFNIFDRRITKSKYFSNNQKKIEIHARSIFLQGLLLADESNMPKKFLKFKAVKNWFKWLQNNEVTSLQAAINLPFLTQRLSKIILGFNDYNQFIASLRAINSKEIKYPSNLYSNQEKLINPYTW